MIIIITKGMLYLVDVSNSNPENPNALSPKIANTYLSLNTNLDAIANGNPIPIVPNVPLSNFLLGISCSIIVLPTSIVFAPSPT